MRAREAIEWSLREAVRHRPCEATGRRLRIGRFESIKAFGVGCSAWKCAAIIAARRNSSPRLKMIRLPLLLRNSRFSTEEIFLDFPGRRFRKLQHKFDSMGRFKVREMIACVGDQFRFRGRSA